MNQEDLVRFNELSEKIIQGTHTQAEFQEFEKLLNAWNAYEELNNLQKLANNSI